MLFVKQEYRNGKSEHTKFIKIKVGSLPSFITYK